MLASHIRHANTGMASSVHCPTLYMAVITDIIWIVITGLALVWSFAPGNFITRHS